MLQSSLFTTLKDKLLIVAFVVLGSFSLYQCHHVPAPVRVETIKYVPTIISKDKDGKESAKVQETVVTKSQMKEITKEDKKALKATQINSETNIVDHNSLTLRDDTISIKRYDTKKWLLGKITQHVNITHTDTSIHSIEANSLTFKEPKTIFVIGPYAGINILTMKPAIGISVTLNLWSIKSRR